ncbi:MAG: HAD family hydrolase [Gammaproteobacteria bacterium]|nr:HAD family hydrolase [Gammaproteobacteria bacterium]MBT5201878.1 HAD family hydrolase [Gammaproteobacteria bacterium]MBT5604106.1 HAD family hydrolase [Gammaproteobacteria bacterium]MBT6246482.1 HAD family hydrolase [Gammaproteobacteria bacterium]
MKAILFDLDGTLLNTLSSISTAFNQALEQMGYPQHSTEQYRYFIGDGVFQCARRCLPVKEANKATIARLVELERIEYQKSWHQQVQPYDGVADLLVEIGKRKLSTAVLTNKDQQAAEQCVQRFFPSHEFSHILGYDGTRPHKPDPTGGNWILEKLGIDEKHAMMVGDTAVDILTGKACKMRAVGVLWGFREAAELNEAGADHIIQQPCELLALL